MVTRKEALAQITAPGQPYEVVEITALGRAVRAFKNAPPTLRAIYEATRSDATFLVYEDERLTYEQVWRRGCALATALVQDFGVKKGDRVAISMRNYPEWIIAFQAITSIGAIAVAMNALWQPHEMEYGLKHSGSSVLIADQERLDRLAAAEHPPEALKIIATRSANLPAGARTLEAIFAARDGVDILPWVVIEPDDDALMLFTSGSTGYPKGAVSSHRAIVHALLSWEVDAQSAVLTGLIPAPDPAAPQTVALLGIPLFHVTGLHAVYLTAYRYQRRIVSMYKWDAEKAAELIERERVTHFAGPPAVTGDLVEVARKSNRDMSSLVSLGGGGASRAPEQVRAIDAVFENARPGTGWGMTETNAIGCGIGAADYLTHPESSGRASAVMDLRVVDPASGKVLGPNQRGELQIRGVSMMREYWNRPEANAEAFVDGDWFKTGDVAYLDDEGFVYIVDRIKDLVIRGGENIGCGAVEAALLEHPDVREACVYGVPDQRLGEEVGATVYATAKVDPEELRGFLVGKLAKFEIPRYVRVETEPLPRIATGKIAKRQLRAEHTERLAG